MKTDLVLTVPEAAALLKTSRQQIRKMIREDILPAVKVGREWRINAEYLKEFVEQAME